MSAIALRDLGSLQLEGEALRELAALLEPRAALEQRLDDLDRQQRAASERREGASDALAQLEARAAAGEQVSGAARTKAERELLEARAHWGEPWAERRAGVSRAIAARDDDVRRFVASRFGDLKAELETAGEHVARELDEAAAHLVRAHARREAIASQLISLCSMLRPTRPGDVSRSAAEPAVRAASALLDGGGEARPVVLADPREPRHGGVIADAEPEPAKSAAVFR
jgi:hypothetical protein